MSTKRCVEDIASAGGYQLFTCPNPAKYGDYCGTHCPERRAARAAKRGPSKWERECAARKRYDVALDAVLAAAREISYREGKLDEALAAFDAITGGWDHARRPIVG